MQSKIISWPNDSSISGNLRKSNFEAPKGQETTGNAPKHIGNNLKHQETSGKCQVMAGNNKETAGNTSRKRPGTPTVGNLPQSAEVQF